MSTERILDFEQALDLLAQHFPEGPLAACEEVELTSALGRVLSSPITADRDQPPFDRSTRDGYAVRLPLAQTPSAFRVIGSLRAGEAWAGSDLQEGEAIQIMTGAPVPASAHSVVMVEHVTRAGDQIALTPGRGLAQGENIVRRGEEARAGSTVVPRGTRLGAAEIALAASCGQVRLSVFAKPTVAVVATGDELVDANASPGPQQIRNSNAHAIGALVELSGGTARRLAIARDDREVLAERVMEALDSDLIVFSGGVSAGDYDLVEQVMYEHGAEFLFTGVRMQPGRPVVFGKLPGPGGTRFFFGLPGNPISTQVTFTALVAPLLRALGGEERPAPRWALARSSDAIAPRPALTRLLPARLENTEVRLIPWQGSGDLAANARANCYAELLPGREYEAGALLRILLR